MPFEPDIIGIARINQAAQKELAAVQESEPVKSWEELPEYDKSIAVEYVRARISNPTYNGNPSPKEAIFIAIVDSLKGILPKPRPR